MPLAERQRFGRNLQDARLNKGLTQLELSHLLGVWPQTLQRWEYGETFPVPRRLHSISEALDVSIRELREEKPNGNSPSDD